MIRKFFLVMVTMTVVFLGTSSAYVESLDVQKVVQGQKQIVVAGEQHGISYQVYRGSLRDHYVIRFYMEGKSPLNTRITDLQVELKIENGTLLSVAPAGKIDGNRSIYKFSSRRGLNSQLQDKGLFLIFKLNAEENSKGKLSFIVDEYLQLSKTSSTKKSDYIIFSLQ